MDAECPRCGEGLEVDDSLAGEKVKCRICTHEFVLPPPKVATPPTPRPPALPKAPTPAKPKSASGPTAVQVVAVLLCVAFVLTGVASCNKTMGSSFSPTYGYSNRFNSDNAYGASANALEYIAKHLPATGPAPWFICGPLCWLIASVEGLRRAVAQQNRRSGDEDRTT